jgi:hypothetical protein
MGKIKIRNCSKTALGSGGGGAGKRIAEEG